MTAITANKPANVTLRIDPEIKQQADALFSTLGMSLSTAFNVFIRQALREGRLPFQPSVAKAEWENELARRETEEILNNPKAKRYSRDEFFKWVDNV